MTSYRSVLVRILVHHIEHQVVVDVAILFGGATSKIGFQLRSHISPHSSNNIRSVDTGRGAVVCNRIWDEVVFVRVVPTVVVGLVVRVVVTDIFGLDLGCWRGHRCRIEWRRIRDRRWRSHTRNDRAWTRRATAAEGCWPWECNVDGRHRGHMSGHGSRSSERRRRRTRR